MRGHEGPLDFVCGGGGGGGGGGWGGVWQLAAPPAPWVCEAVVGSYFGRIGGGSGGAATTSSSTASTSTSNGIGTGTGTGHVDY